jgi:hypothetical protein
LSYWAFVARASGSFSPFSCASFTAIPLSFAAWVTIRKRDSRGGAETRRVLLQGEYRAGAQG